MTVAQERVGMPLDAFIRAFDEDGAFELIDGERIPKLPTMQRHSTTIDTFFMALRVYCDQHDLGLVRAENTFILPERDDPNWVKDSRTPDILFISVPRMAAYEAAVPDALDKPLVIVPDMVVEVVSPTDKYPQVLKKVSLYLDDGVQMVIVVDPLQRSTSVYYQDAPPQHLKADDTLDGGTIIPGFRMVLSSLFSIKITG